MTLPGIEPATFRIMAQCLDHSVLTDSAQ